MGSATQNEIRAWVLATLPKALSYASSLIGGRDTAEDVVQDCYCRLLKKSDVYDLPRDGWKILLRAITNACIDRTVRRRVVLSLDEPGPSETKSPERADPRAEDAPASAMGRELEGAIEQGLNRLPVVQRAVLQLRSAGHSLEEIAEALGLQTGHAGVLLHRARETLSTHLAPYL